VVGQPVTLPSINDYCAAAQKEIANSRVPARNVIVTDYAAFARTTPSLNPLETLQYVGYAQSWASVQLEGEPASFVARYRVEDGTTVAALAVNRPTELGALRTELAAGLGPERLAA
jgi:hypothetical protein